MNSVTIMGRLSRDPDKKTFDNGSLVNFSVATDESYKNKDGERVEKAEFHNVVFHGSLGDVIQKYFAKGSRILLTGKLRTRSWEDKDGNKRYSTEIIGDKFEFVESKGKGPKQEDSGSGEEESDDLPF